MCFEAGELIMTSKPFVYVLNNNLRGEFCDFCLKKSSFWNSFWNSSSAISLSEDSSNSTLLRCSKCAFAYYCNKECQKNAWSDHKQECKNIVHSAPNMPSESLRLISRLIFKIKNNRSKQIYEAARTYSRTFNDLISHSEYIKKDLTRCQLAIALFANLKLFIGEENIPTPSEFMEIFGKMVINTFDISDQELKTIGCGLYLGASILDHSCNPNAIIVFTGTVLHVRALYDIPSSDLKKVYISYIDEMETTDIRQAQLKNQYYFSCSCSRCNDISLNNLMLKVNSSNNNDKDIIISTLRKDIEQLKDMKKCRANSREILNISMQLLEQNKDVLAETNVLRIRLLDLAFDACIEEGCWDEALHFGLATLVAYHDYYGPNHAHLGLQLYRIGSIQLYLDDLYNAERTLLEAKKILTISHGTSHPLYEAICISINSI